MVKKIISIFLVIAVILSIIYILMYRSHSEYERKLSIVRKSEVSYEIYFNEFTSEYSKIRNRLMKNIENNYFEEDIYKEVYNINYRFKNFLNDSYLCSLLDINILIEKNLFKDVELNNYYKTIRMDTRKLFSTIKRVKDSQSVMKEDHRIMIKLIDKQINFISLVNENLINSVRNKEDIERIYQGLIIESKKATQFFRDGISGLDEDDDVYELIPYIETRALVIMISHQEKEAEELYYLMKRISNNNYASVTEIVSSQYFKKIEELLDEIERYDNQN